MRALCPCVGPNSVAFWYLCSHCRSLHPLKYLTQSWTIPLSSLGPFSPGCHVGSKGVVEMDAGFLWHASRCLNTMFLLEI